MMVSFAFSLLAGFLLCGLNNGLARAYIPAVASNNTAGLNLNDTSSITLRWPPMGTYTEGISYQLVGSNSTGFDKGAIVHFTENNGTNNDTTATPWLAMISCDSNSTDSSLELDIFTQAQALGAVAALLYTTTSETCIINPHYADPLYFNQVMDIFATQSSDSARLIENQFQNTNTSYYWFDAGKLNASADAIDAFVQDGIFRKAPGFLVATLKSGNVTDNTQPNNPPNGGDGSGNTKSDNGGPNTGLAMIILYAITGCVSALFCVVILSGAVRAFRHPERYGPRAGNPNIDGPGGESQTRTTGLTRAILDTFPIIKFGRGADDGAIMPVPVKDVETDVERHAGNAPETFELVHRRNPTDGSATLADGDAENDRQRQRASSSSSVPPLPHLETLNLSDLNPHSMQPYGALAPNSPSHPAAEAQDSATPVDPAAIGRETCPICIVDFEVGDDLRVLPCEGKHRFHKECVDPWLLDLSGSCPLCREDFHALETMAAAGPRASEDGHNHLGLQPPNPTYLRSPMTATSPRSRFSRYLRFAQKQQRQRQHADQEQYSEDEADGSDPRRSTWHDQ